MFVGLFRLFDRANLFHRRETVRKFILVLLSVTSCAVLSGGCDDDGDTDADADVDGDSDADADADLDADGDADADGDVAEDADIDDDEDGDRIADSDLDDDGDAGGDVPGDWVTIGAGTFTMGSPTSEESRDAHETQHEVTLTRDFMLLSTEVTQADFEMLMGYNPSRFSWTGDGIECGGDCPVEQVSWSEAAAYCNLLSSIAGLAPCYECHACLDKANPAIP